LCINIFLLKRLPGVGSEPGSSWFHLFSHFFTTLPLSHSGSPSCVLILTKTGLGYILGNLFTNTSDQPGGRILHVRRLSYVKLLGSTRLHLDTDRMTKGQCHDDISFTFCKNMAISSKLMFCLFLCIHRFILSHNRQYSCQFLNKSITLTQGKELLVLIIFQSVNCHFVK
jgi:hypothetical protein